MRNINLKEYFDKKKKEILGHQTDSLDELNNKYLEIVEMLSIAKKRQPKTNYDYDLIDFLEHLLVMYESIKPCID